MCGSFHTLSLSAIPSPVESEENDLPSDEEKTAPSLTSTTLDLQVKNNTYLHETES